MPFRVSCSRTHQTVFLSFTVKQQSHYQDGRVVKALDLSSNGRVVRVGSNPTPGKKESFFNNRVNF